MAVDVLAHEEPKRDRDVTTTLTAWCRRVTGDVVHDFPNNGWRMRELAAGIHYTVVNGEVLLEKGTHTGSYPGRVLHNARYHATHNGRG